MDPDKLTTLTPADTGLGLGPGKRRRWWLYGGVIVAIVVLLAGLLAGFVWYQRQLLPVDVNNIHKKLIKIHKGETTSDVAQTLYDNGLIRNEQIFRVYARLHDIAPQAGAYMIAPDSDLPAIASKLGSGQTDSFDLSISPGLTVAEIKQAFKKSGFGDQAIEAAFAANYDIPILQTRPSGAPLEGYIMGYAQKFSVDATPTDIVRTAIEGLNSYAQAKQLKTAFQAHGLSFYEGLILASIVQKEVSRSEDMPHVAQVFYSRLQKGMPLGSDVTFIYGARLQGVAPSTDLDSPYNTRIHKGLPPTPIANPGKDALYAVAHPSKTNDLFFVAGDDGVTYFSKTNQEHERLTRLHCHKNCQLPDS